MSQDIHVSWSGRSDEKPTGETMKRRSFGPVVTDVSGLARALAEGRSVIGNYTGQKRDLTYARDGRVHSTGRRSAFWLSTQTVCIDCDGNTTGMSLDEIVSRLPVRPHIAYRTMSCPEDADLKFRLVYVLDEPVSDWGDYARVWTVLDRQFRDATGLENRLKNGCVYGSDHAMKTATCVVHGARKGSPMIVAPDSPLLPVGSDDGLISRFYEIFGEDPVYNKEYPRPNKNLSLCGIKLYNRNASDLQPACHIIQQNDRFLESYLITENIIDEFSRIGRENPSEWPEIILKPYTPNMFIRKSEISAEFQDPTNPNIRYVPKDGTAWRISFPRTKKKIGSGRRVKSIKAHMRKCLICRPDADLLLLVVNAVYFVDRYVNLTDGKPLTVEDVVDAVIDVMEEDRGDWDPEELFKGTRRPKFTIDTWGEAKSLGLALDRETYMNMSKSAQKTRSAIIRGQLNKIRGRLCGQARTELSYRSLDEVYNPLYPVGWNMKNIEERWPEVPHSRNTLKKYCEARGLDPQTSKGGRPKKK